MNAIGRVSADVAAFTDELRRLSGAISILADKPDETPEATLKALWSTALGSPISVCQAGSFIPAPLDAESRRRLDILLQSRLAGTPLAHLTGRQDFMGMVLLASPAALVPRKETELLGYAALAKASALARSGPVVIDVCTGAGNLAFGIAFHIPDARVFGSDLSASAIALARENARFLGLESVEFRCGDLLEPFVDAQFQGEVDIIVCNPPYISSTRVDTMPSEIREHEPRLAFDGGPFGVHVLRRVLHEGPPLLAPGGWLLIEVGRGQGPQIHRLLSRSTAFDLVEPIADGQGEIRGFAARKQPLAADHR